MKVDGWRGRGRPKKIWMDFVTNDMLEKGVDYAMTVNRGKWNKMTYCILRQPQIRWNKGRKMMMIVASL